VERCFELAGGATPRVESAIVRGIVDDRASFVGEQPSAGALEAYNLHLIGRLAALKRESYRQLCRLATGIRQDDARRLLEQNLHDEESLGFWIDENAASLIRPSTPAHGAQRH
jgi:ferritin-like metal-binding protein YciE